MNDAQKFKDFIECEMIYDPEDVLMKEMTQKVNESTISIRLNSEVGIDLEGLKSKPNFEDGKFTMDLQVPLGVWRYTQVWVNRRSRRALKGNRQKYYYYYRESWERYVENFWPKQKEGEMPSQEVTITYPGV